MDYEIVWSDDEKGSYRHIAEYLLDVFGFAVADKFTDTIADKLKILEKMPLIGRRLDRLTAVRKLPLRPHNMVYHTVVINQVVILNILDSRREKFLQKKLFS